MDMEVKQQEDTEYDLTISPSFLTSQHPGRDPVLLAFNLPAALYKFVQPRAM